MAIITAPSVVEVTSNYSATGFTVEKKGHWYSNTQNFANTAPNIGDQFYYTAYDGNGNSETGVLAWLGQGILQRNPFTSTNASGLASFGGPVTVSSIPNPSPTLSFQYIFSNIGASLIK